MLNVCDHGAVNDGTTLNTAAIQALIDQAAEAGGGTLLFPPGRYLTGGLELRRGITLHIEGGATLLGSGDLDHYRLWEPTPEPFHEGRRGIRALLFALDAADICLEGAGTVDGQGHLFERYRDVRTRRPRNIWFARCQRVTVRGLHLRCSGFWMQHYLKCTDLRLIDLDVYNHGSTNNDGIDIDSCRDVLVRGCRVDSADDAICLKSGAGTPTENVVVSDCVTRSHCNHIKTGTESNGDFRNIRVSDIVMVPSENRESHRGTEGADYRGACGIALGAVDGGALENITVQNVTMDGVRVPFFIRLGDRGRDIPGVGEHQPVRHARHLRISGVRARAAGPQGGYVAGLQDAPVEDVVIADCDLEFEGGGDPALLTRDIPEARDGYPSMEIFGDLPAYALWTRHVRGLTLRDFRCRLQSADPRPAIAWQQTTNITLDTIRTD